MDSTLEVDVIHWRDIEVNSKKFDDEYGVVIFGPGPGHPDEYKHLSEMIKIMLKNKNIYVMGICLGHQLIGKSLGYEIMTSKSLVHGQSEQITIPAWRGVFSKEIQNTKVEVQRYNSLSVKNSTNLKPDIDTLVRRGEILMMRFKNGVSYQFHPESVGTTCPQSFFKEALEFLYNRRDEHSTESYRSI